MYCRIASLEIVPVVAQKYERLHMWPFFFISGNLAARVDPTPPLIFPIKAAGEYLGGAVIDR
jgi:hypothetical protein